MVTSTNNQLAYNEKGELISFFVEVDLISFQNAKQYIPSGKQLGFSHIEILEAPDEKIANELAAIAKNNGLTVFTTKKAEKAKLPVVEFEQAAEVEAVSENEIFSKKRAK